MLLGFQVLAGHQGYILNQTESEQAQEFYSSLSQEIFLNKGDIKGDILIVEKKISGSSSYLNVYLKNHLVYETKIHSRTKKYIKAMANNAARKIERRNLKNILSATAKKKGAINEIKQNLEEANSRRDTESGANDGVKRVCDRADIPTC